MTKDEALKMALEALEHEAKVGNDNAYFTERQAIKEALAKPWVWLTNEEVEKLKHIYDWAAGWTLEMFARAIEAKLKEKNT